MARLCKACGKACNDAKERRLLNGQAYSALFDIVDSCSNHTVTAREIHQILASTQSYTCKPCHSALCKYESIRKQVDKMKTFVRSAFFCSEHSEHPMPIPVSYEHKLYDESSLKVYITGALNPYTCN